MPAASAAAGNLTQQGPKIVPPAEPQLAGFGWAVAISADGDTALVGAPGTGAIDDVGVAVVYVRSGSTWVQQAVLTGAGEVGAGMFGKSVAISADGDTALVGAPEDNERHGAVWAFHRTGTSWAPLGAKLTDPKEAEGGAYGTSLALSADGAEAAVGEPGYSVAWVYKGSAHGFKSGHRFQNQHEAVCMCGALYGSSIALAGDGNTLMLGSSPIVPSEEFASEQGAELVYVRSGSKWTKQAGPIVPRGGATALDGDGNTALTAKREWGASVLERAGTSWSVGPQLQPNDANGGCGCRHSVLPSVSLSADGQSALIGYRYDHEFVGAAWLFSRSGSNWTQQGTKLIGGEMSGEAEFGWGSALSGDGGTAVIGGPDDGAAGAVWFFTRPATPPAPSVTALSPNKGPVAGGTSVTIEGNFFATATAVHFGAATASFTVESDKRITAQSPAGTPGKVDVTVTTAGGTSAVSKADRFTYKPH